MKNLTLLSLLLFSMLTIKGQELINKPWQVTSSYILLDTDTTFFYRSSTTNNKLDLSKIVYNFQETGTYQGTNMQGLAMAGTWFSSNDTLIIDSRKSPFLFINQEEFVIVSPFAMPDSTGGVIRGQSILHFSNMLSSNTENLLKGALLISPNPTKGPLNLSFPFPIEPKSHLQIINLRGEEIYQQDLILDAGGDKLDLDLNFLSAGLYFLYINMPNGQTLSSKIIIAR